ncbi:MAG: queuosine precursor transporter [Bacteroidia bacterium]|nr:queuosine precursor transporter [Bacteroidia bacterium]
MLFNTRKDLVFIILAGIFITNAVVAELIGAKLIELGPFFGMGPFIMSIGIIPWPVVFLTTDIINEYYGRSGVRKLSFITAGLIAYAFVILFFAMQVKAAPIEASVTDANFNAVFGQSMWIIVGSIVAFLTSQFVDVFVFWLLRDKTGGKMIWLRTTGSTIVSQLIDTFVVLGIAFWLPGKMTTAVFINAALTGYSVKLVIAVVLTPVIYLIHFWIDKYLGDEEAHQIIKQSAQESLHHKVIE